VSRLQGKDLNAVSRRWLRRTTYLLASGVLVAGGAAAFLQTRTVGGLILGKLDQVLRRETGLGLKAREVRFHLPSGRLVLEDLEWGQGLLRAASLEVRVDLWAWGAPHIRSVRMERPLLTLDPRTLQGLHAPPTDPKAPPSRWRLDLLELRQGRFRVDKGIRVEGPFTFRGGGPGPGRIEGTWNLPGWQLFEGGTPTHRGDARLRFALSDPRLEAGGTLSSTGGEASFQAAYLVAPDTVQVTGKASLDLARLVSALRGQVRTTFSLVGPPASPTWRVEARGEDLAGLGLRSGTADLDLRGGAEGMRLDALSWVSDEGRLKAEGTWNAKAGTTLALRGESIALARLADLSRVQALAPARADLEARIHHPGTPWTLPLERLQASVTGRFTREGQEAGRFALEGEGGTLRIQDLKLDLPDLQVQAQGLMRFQGRSPAAIEGSGWLTTDATQVAQVLRAWDLKDLPMAGHTQARASVAWNRASGLVLAGWVDVQRPRWQGATADSLRTDVSIIGSDLRLTNIELARGAGSADGTLWLTWGPRLPGETQMDMCYSAFRLPIEEGLKAADLDPLKLPLRGLGSGWVSLAGPYDHLLLTGSGQTQQASAYGITVPALSADISMDLAESRLHLGDIRLAESLEALSSPESGPLESLSLRGELDLDLNRKSWRGGVRGKVDSGPLGLPGPRFLGQVEGRMEGPWALPMGPLALPSAQVSFSRGRLFLGEQSLEGLEGALEAREGALEGWFGIQGRTDKLLQFRGWHQGRGLLGALDVDVRPGTADTGALAQRLTADLMRDLNLQGRAQGVWEPEGLHWTGTVDRFTGTFQGFEAGQTRPATLEGTERAFSLDMDLAGAGQGAAPGATLRIHGSVPFGATRNLALAFDGKADLGRVKHVVDALVTPGQYSLLADLQPAGSATLALTLGGTYREPLLDGRLDLEGGQLRIRTYPQSAEDVSLSLRFDGRTVRIPEETPLQGRLASGALKAFGTATWAPGGLATYDLRARLQDFQFRDIPEGFDLQGTVDATLKGGNEGGLLKGTLDAKHMRYRADVHLSDLIMATALGGPLAGNALDPDDPLRTIDLDLDLRLGEPWEFDTNLLKLQGRPYGTFKVMGTLSQPGLKGAMEFLPGGRLTNLLPAGDIVVERGSIDFKDPRLFNPILNVHGRVDVPPFAVNLGIQGSLDQLTFNPTSTPSLRQEEIVAILIDPALAPTVGNLSGSAASTAAHYGLANTGTGLLSSLAIAGFQEQLRQAFSLDRVNFALRPGTGSPETTVTLGKTFDLLGRRTPLVLTHRRAGGVVTLSSQLEWRFGDFVLQLGASQSGTTGVNPSGEVRYTWSPR
jgi:hypothetical protein